MTPAEQLYKSVEGLTITGLLRRNARQFPDKPALTSGIGPDAVTLSWSQLRSEVAALTRGLSGLGISRGDRMLIAMSKRPEHWITDLAAIHLGALPCTTYDTLSTEQIRYVAWHSAATVLVLEGEEQMRRWRPVLKEARHLRHVVVLDPDVAPSGDRRFVGYGELCGQEPCGERPFEETTSGEGSSEDTSSEDTSFEDTSFEVLTDTAVTDQPLTVVYTSGTTGEPKGVVLSHRNVIHESLMQDRLVSLPEHPRSVAYLPMAHIAERVLGIYMPICNAGHVTICPDFSQLLPTLAAVRPHGFFGVPRVWEKLAAGLRAQVGALRGEEAAAVAEAREAALEVFRLRSAGADVPAGLAARAEKLETRVLRPFAAALGFGECRRAFSGAAPIPVGVLEFLAGMGLPVYEVWGLSETTGAATIGTPEAFALGAVGRPGPGVEVKAADDGELLVRGPVVFAGYLQADGAVEPAVDRDGWLATGDIGTVDERGIVAVTDRKKEIIITDGGKNVAPTKVESLLRVHPLIAVAVAVGDRRPYVTALLVLDEEAAPLWARAHGIPVEDLGGLARRPEVLAALDQVVEEANSSLSRAEQVKKYRVLDRPWTVESGELTPKLTLRRKAIEELHAPVIESMYAADAHASTASASSSVSASASASADTGRQAG